jgi:hypothetical protein
MPCQVAHLSAELAWTAGGEDPLATQTIPSARNNASFDDQRHSRVPITDIKKLVVACEVFARPLAKRSANCT